MTKNIRRLLLLSSLGAFCAAWPRPPATSAGEEVDVVVNKSNTVGDQTATSLKPIFVCDKSTWPNGKRVSVLMLAPGSPERAVVLRDVYKMSEGDYSKYFLQAAFSGRITAPPKDLASAGQMKQDVAANPGAIGYLKSSDVDDSVKVVMKLQ
jgi:ABC-type phosphate transport system substrate-binding protein